MRTATLLLGMWCALVLAPACRSQPRVTLRRSKPPNIVVLMADDVGFDDLGFNGNPNVQTPHLDHLAASGLVVSDFYVTPVCAPTRASFLTGRHHLRTGVSHVHGGKDAIHRDEILIPQALGELGYRSGMWGKWHSGTASGYLPWQRGFDEAYAAELYKHRNATGRLNGQAVSHAKWSDEVIVDYALDFIRRSDDKPFFAYLSFMSCHSPLDAPEDLVANYEKAGFSHNLATLYGMVSMMDREIGRFMQGLTDSGHLDDTVVFFLSDNGPASLGGILTAADHKQRNVSGRRGQKGDVWDMGARSPLVIRYGPAHRQGVVPTLLDVADLFPTFVELAGGDLADATNKLDGQSFAAQLRGGKPKSADDKSVLVYSHPAWPANGRPWSAAGHLNEYAPIAANEKRQRLPAATQSLALRQGPYKLLLHANPNWNGHNTPSETGALLFNVLQDPSENVSLNAQEPERVRAMTKEAHARFESLRDSPHGFAPVVFDIKSQNENDIFLYAPKRLAGGVRNGASASLNWRAPGDAATFVVVVQEGGRYQARLETDQSSDLASSQAFTLDVGGQSFPLSAVDLSPGQYDLTLRLRELKDAKPPPSGWSLVRLVLTRVL